MQLYCKYTFEPILYHGGQMGSYELTLIAVDGARQWSEDPEFDTSS